MTHPMQQPSPNSQNLSVALADTSSEDWKVVGLSAVQAIGVASALGIHTFSKRWYTMPERFFWGVFVFLAGTFFVSVIVALRSQAITEIVNRILSEFFQTRLRLSGRNVGTDYLQNCLRLFAVVDIFGAWVCIITTGGSERSIYVPFLFVITPFVIIVNVLPWPEVLKFAGFSFTMFLFGTCPLTLVDGFVFADPKIHVVFLSISTFFCTAVPVIFYVLQTGFRREGEGREPSRTERA